MDRLKEAANQTHMNFMANWFPRTGNAAVLHNPPELDGMADAPETDVLELDLRNLSSSRPVSASMRTFRELLEHWSRYNEDRVFAGDYGTEPPG